MGINGIVLFIIIFTVCLTCGIFIPIYSNTTFDSPKLAVMLIGVSVGCICWAIKGFNNGIYCKTKGVNLAILIYLLCNIASMVFSHNWVISLFGGYKLYGGVLSLLIYLAFFYLSANFINKQNIKVIFRWLIVTSVLCGVYGFCRKYGIINMQGLPVSAREYSTFGNPVFFGCFLSMMINIVLYQIIETRKLYLYAILLLLITSVFMSGTRSAVMAILFVSIPLLFFYKNINWIKIVTVLAVFIVFIIGIHFSGIDNGALYHRLVAAVHSVDLSGRYRFYNEGIAAGLTYPLFGFGQDLIRPHNLFIDHFAKLGIVGLLAFCYLGYRFIITVFNNRVQDRNLYCTLIAICLSYLVFRQFNPDYIPITLLFSMFAGAIYGIQNCNNYS